MNWLSTPPPIPGGGWVEWRGRYVPGPADVGTPFQFRMIVTIPSRSSVALDGPMTAVLAVPEPPTAVGASALLAAAMIRRRSSR